MRSFSWICLTRGRHRDKGGVECGCGLLLGCHDGLMEIKEEGRGIINHVVKRECREYRRAL